MHWKPAALVVIKAGVKPLCIAPHHQLVGCLRVPIFICPNYNVNTDQYTQIATEFDRIPHGFCSKARQP